MNLNNELRFAHACQQNFTQRFIDLCQKDEQVLAAFLGGSNARNAADVYSDLDLCVITTDEAYERFCASRESFMQQIGELVFFEVFGKPELVFFIYVDGTEGELYFCSKSGMDRLHSGPFKVLLDKKGILDDFSSSEEKPDASDQHETLRRLITTFWHELSHFITAMGRGQLWWAFGQLESLRRQCVGLLRLQHDFSVYAGGDEPYFKVENDLPDDELTPLLETCVLRERQAMYEAVVVMVNLYRKVAPSLAKAHELRYPLALEQVMLSRLKEISIC
jgi:predicted nucleotidyltransferase